MSTVEQPRTLPDVLRVAAGYGVPLVHFGQTVLWDEPTKAVLYAAMRTAGVTIPVRAGVHDTDYFSKLEAAARVSGPFAILPANDGTTRGLWVGPGECSVLLGGEHRVPLKLLAAHGVPVRRLATLHPTGPSAFADVYTAAWGWRGLARIAEDNTTARDVRTSEVSRDLCKLLCWAVEQSLRLIADEPTRSAAEANGAWLLRTVCQVLDAHHGASLSDTFGQLLGEFAAALLAERPPELSVTSSSRHFRFARDTQGLPRFGPLDLFLDPATRERAEEAYDGAVAGTGTYGLGPFGEGALPFDLVVPGRGRGTIFRTVEEVRADLPEGPITLGGARGLRNREQLAALVERRLGSNCSLVGKAVVLPLMFLTESIMVLAEGGSAYIGTSTRRLVEGLARHGIELALHPILRLRYHSLDALEVLDTCFCLPEHLADAFGTEHISAKDFARRWREVVAECRDSLRRLAGSRGAAIVLEELSRRDVHAAERLERYRCLQRRMREAGHALSDRSAELRDVARQAHETRAEILDLESRSGALRRDRLRPLWRELDAEPPEGRKAEIHAEIAAIEEERARMQERLRALRAEAQRKRALWRAMRRALQTEQRSGVGAVIHHEMHGLEEAAALDRLKLVRRNIQTIGLAAVDRRPTAWWFLLLRRADGSNPWYDEVIRRCEAYLEWLGSAPTQSAVREERGAC